MKRTCLFVSLFFLFIPIIFATTQTGIDAQNLNPFQSTMISRTDSEVRFNLELESPQWITNEDSETGFDLMTAEFQLGGMLEEDGQPPVPVASSLFRLPPRSGVTVEILSSEYETLSGIDYGIFHRVDEETSILQIAEHPEDAWYPEILAEVTEPAIMHDFRVANLITYPVQVNPARNEVRVYHNLEVAIRFEGTDERNALDAWPTRISQTFVPFYRQLLDWDENELDEYVLYRGGVQVVMRNNATLMAMMEPWFEWKRQKGWDLELFLDTDPDVGSWTDVGIRNALRDRYAGAETKFDYVVIVGDNTGPFAVPPAGVAAYGGHGYGDHEYSCVAGTDALPDVSLGRMSMESNTHVINYVNKVLAYETDPNMNDTSWYLRGMVSVSSASSGFSTVLVGRYHRRNMFNLGYTTVDTAWISPWGGLSNTQVVSTCINRINTGVSFYATRGYIGSGLDISEIGNLNNENKLPVVIDLTCYTGNWASDTGINETYMRAGTANSPRGAIGAFGCETSHTNPRYNNMLSTAAGHSSHQLLNPAMGDMNYSAKFHIYNAFNGYDNSALNQFNHWFNLMGDPLVWLWTDIPDELDVETINTFELGRNSIEVEVTLNDEPVEGAWVTFYKVDGSEEIIVTAETDIDGTVILQTPVRFEGEAVLTVSEQNCLPVQIEFDIEALDEHVSYSEISIVDNGTGGTNGNGNGIAEAGETVGLQIEAMNFGTATINDLTITASSDDDWLGEISGQATVTSLTAGASEEADGLILVQVLPQAQQDWLSHIDFVFSADEGSWVHGYSLELSSVEFAFVDVNIPGGILPGESDNITIEVANIGDSDGDGPITGYLQSMDPTLRVTQSVAEFPAMPVGADDESDEFTIEVRPDAIRGTVARTRLIMITQSGKTDTVFVPITFGTKRSQDPSGPDGYGYYAFDNTDTAYEDAPSYDWVEINPSASNNDYDGQNLNLSDTGDDQDDATAIVLPFTVTYYGEEFNHLTVCSNGWVAMGQQADMRNPRNYPIPSPSGPDYMIAPYWDERTTSGGGVYSYYDDTNGRFIVEWYHLGGYNGSSPCTFEVIFYDQIDDHETRTGDTEFLFQYNAMQHMAGADHTGADVYYWTTGIENGTQSDGLELAYWNQHRPGTATITNGRAILFTNDVNVLRGNVEGYVYRFETEDPIANASVEILGTQYSATTSTEGYYLIEDAPAGIYTLRASARCYNDVDSLNVEVIPDSTIVQNFELPHPEIEVEPEEIFEIIGQEDSTSIEIAITNNGNGLLVWWSELSFGQAETWSLRDDLQRGPVRETDDLDEVWDVVFGFDLDNSETRNRGITFDGEHFWISGSDNYDPSGPNKLYKYDDAGNLLEVYDQPVEEPSPAGFYGITWANGKLYGADNRLMYEIEVGDEGLTVLSTWDLPVNPARYIIYDPQADAFWVGDLGTDIFLVNYNGEVIDNIDQDFSPRGGAYFPEDNANYPVYFICSDPGQEEISIVKMNPETGNFVETHSFIETEYTPTGLDITYQWNPLIYTLATINDGVQDNVVLFELAANSAWITIDPTSGTVAPDAIGYMDVMLRGANLPPDQYSVFINFYSNACPETLTVPVTIDVVPVDEGWTDQPFEWSFDSIYPNPFNPSTTLHFTMKMAGNVSFHVFDILGRQVEHLETGYLTAGPHSVMFDGSHLASGIYFVQMNAGPVQEVRKIVLLK